MYMYFCIKFTSLDMFLCCLLGPGLSFAGSIPTSKVDPEVGERWECSDPDFAGLQWTGGPHEESLVS